MLSVVVPAYGVGEFLPACLDSILAQTLDDLEVIVVDDGSPDECGEIADAYAVHDPRVSVLHIENSGLGPARNAGTRVASGKYLAFADSDDLIPPRAYEALVSSLEHTGSDLAAGNAWRWIPGKGLVPSWTHRQACAETRLATHIRDFPLLVRDRMAWNKVYRRSFWDANGFEFPPIRYEDFPVTIAAHLAARSVDVLANRVYIWREREEETSITQRSLELANVTDRVVSAEMVLDKIVGETAGVRHSVHAYFAEVDLVTAATAVVAADETDRAALLAIAVRLARRLRPRRPGTPQVATLIHAAVLANDWVAVEALLAWRLKPNRQKLLDSVFGGPGGRRWAPGVALLLRERPRRKAGLVRGRRLKAWVRSLERQADAVTAEIGFVLRKELIGKARMSAFLEGETGRVRLPATMGKIDGATGSVSVAIPDAVAAELGPTPLRVVLHPQLGAVTWKGGVYCKRQSLPRPYPLSGAAGWVVPSHPVAGTESLAFRRVPEEAIVSAELTDKELVLDLRGDHGYVAVLRPEPSQPLVAAVAGGQARFALSDIVDDPADDPVTSQAYRALVAFPARKRAPLLERAKSANAAAAEVEEVEYETRIGPKEQALAEAEFEVDRSIMVTAPELDPHDAAHPSPTALMDLDRDTATPLILLDSVEPVETASHFVRLFSSRTGTAEIFHQRLDHRPARW